MERDDVEHDPLAGREIALDTIVWDESKRLINIAKHGIDFLRARNLFDGRAVYEEPSPYPEEVRWVRTGIIDDRPVTVIWTLRDTTVRIISARIARDGERRKHRQLHDGGD